MQSSKFLVFDQGFKKSKSSHSGPKNSTDAFTNRNFMSKTGTNFKSLTNSRYT
jgi:hypothetical protein